MAKQTKTLADVQTVTTVNDDQLIPITDASGNVVKVSMSNLRAALIGNLKIGGVNILDGTLDFKGWTGIAGITKNGYGNFSVASISNPSFPVEGYISLMGNRITQPLIGDTQYTLSFLAKGSGILTTHIHPGVLKKVIRTSAVDYANSDGRCGYALTDQWTKHYVTFETLDDVGSSGQILFRVRNVDFSLTDVANFCAVQLEEGNMVTSWFPSYNDIKALVAAGSTTAQS